MMLALVVISVISGQILSRTGKYRLMGIAGMAALTIGMFLLSTMQVDTARWQTIVYMIIMGLGLGVAMPLYTLIVQNAFPVQKLGVVTSATTFFRSIGGTVGVAIMGTVVNNRFIEDYTRRLDPQLQASPQFGDFLSRINPQAIISPETIAGIQQQLQAANVPAAMIGDIIARIQAPIAPALAAATTQAFLLGAVVLALAIVATTFIPEIPLRRRAGRPGMAMEGAEGAAVQAGQEPGAEGLPGAGPNLPPEVEPERGYAGRPKTDPAPGR
jgi:MFS family permease